MLSFENCFLCFFDYALIAEYWTPISLFGGQSYGDQHWNFIQVFSSSSLSDNKRNKEYIDRLSNLPDELLHQVLSFLETKDAIKTCILSKRWKYLWVSVPDLNFNAKSFRKKLKFEKFVTSVMSRHDGPESGGSFHYHWVRRWSFDESLNDKIIDHIVSNKFHHVDLEMGNFVDFPKSLVQCKLIKSLALTGVCVYPQSLDFRNLNSLYLNSCYLSTTSTGDLCSHQDLLDTFAACPNLSNLSISNCRCIRGQRLKTFRITGPQLVNLAIIRISDGLPIACKIEILAPNLTSFKYQYSGLHPYDFGVLNLPCINHVHIDVHLLLGSECLMAKKEKDNLNLINMFKAFHNAQFVNLHQETIKVLTLVPGLLEKNHSPFTNLKSLKLFLPHDSLTIPFHVMSYLLGGSITGEFTLVKS